jgi:hypothetical protein
MEPRQRSLHCDYAKCQKNMELWFDSKERKTLLIRFQTVQTGCGPTETHRDYYSTDTLGSFPPQ